VGLEDPVYQADQMVLSGLSDPDQSFREKNAAVITGIVHIKTP